MAGKVLDMGCGTGEFLGYLQSRGFSVEGVEPALEPREMAIREHSLKVSAKLTDIPAREQFDVITLWHVMEHLHDLHDSWKRIFALLNTEGYLFIAVPDRESWDAEHYKQEWAAYDVPRHLYHFRRRDMRSLLDQHGFQLLEEKKMWLDAPYVSMLSEKYLGRGVLGALIIGGVIGSISNLKSLLGKRPTSSTLYVAQKRRV